MLPKQPMTRRRKFLIGPLVSLVSILLMLGAGEFYFRYIHLQSDAFAFTLMQKRWFDVCWKPIFVVPYQDQQITYRDRAWTDSDVKGKTKVMIVGDSFAAGQGICDAENRFGNILQRRLGPNYAVFNVAVSGWRTIDEVLYPPQYPYQPDIVVLSYVLNDIDGATTAVKGYLPASLAVPKWDENNLLKDSYLADYIYWQVIYRRFLMDNSAAVMQSQLDVFADPKIWDAHRHELSEFIQWTQKINAPLVVIVWPRLDDVKSSLQQTSMVEEFFRSNNTIVISGTQIFRNDAPASIFVSMADAHPNAAAHQRIADALYDTLLKIVNSTVLQRENALVEFGKGNAKAVQ